MIGDSKIQVMKAIYGTLSVILLCSSANAAMLNITNDDTASVEVVIEPGTGTVLPSKKSIHMELKAGEKKTIEVSKDTFGTETFSVMGKVTMPSIYNKCELLSISKNYNIIFTAGKMGGTICKAVEQ
jgi:outer membrane protein W